MLRHIGARGSRWSATLGRMLGFRTRQVSAPAGCGAGAAGRPLSQNRRGFTGRRCFWLRGTGSRGGVPALLPAPEGNVAPEA